MVIAIIAIGFFALPIIGLIWRAPWAHLGDLLTRPSVVQALGLSMATSIAAALAATILGVPLAWLLARINFPGRNAVRALTTLSMVLPPVVGGVALFASFGRRGLFGTYLDRWFGIQLPFSTAGVIVAQTFVAMPFLVLTVESALHQFDRRIEDAARTLGGSSWYVFSRVTVPSIRSALIAGIVLAWARALGEFGATITFAGNLPGRTQTMPLATYLALQTDPDEAIMLALILITVSFATLIALRHRWLAPRLGGSS
ncbi:MAG: molybdate ABC transporter permease subunit [Ilumatobacter coccineus]|uniref:Molybdenum transport system permease n=1 Tax=Ilumatobacter coccineus TaxID=467094 RepID=A0A2G6KFR2_9ACTN|nr:MAG: molybdate ABC transporter permease subunit [Ilumatobacter coccineus]